MKHITPSLLFLTILVSITACSGANTTDGTDTDGTPNTATVSGETSTDTGYKLPEGDFEGREVNFYVSNFRALIQATEENGDTINDAVYHRNRKVEELYNVKFNFTTGSDAIADFTAWWSAAESSILAGDDAIDIIGGYFYRLAAFGVTKGLFCNLNDMPQIAFDQPWWIGDLQNAASVGNKLYICAGNIDPGFYNRVYGLVFNKELAKNTGTDDLYDLVRDGKWTFEAMKNATKAASVDLNGDSVMNDQDQYGMILQSFISVDAFNNAFDIQFVENDENGLPSLLPLSEHFTTAATELREFAHRSGQVYYIQETDLPAIQYTMFGEGRGMILTTSLGNVQKMRDFELDFGILPYPKWDEAQSDYISYAATDPVAGYCVPVTADSDLTGCLLEALTYYGWEDVYPNYYERALKGKNTRDDDSAEMLDIIFENLRFDFIQIYSYGIGESNSPSMMLRNTIYNDTDITSAWASKEKLNKTKIQKFIDALT